MGEILKNEALKKANETLKDLNYYLTEINFLLLKNNKVTCTDKMLEELYDNSVTLSESIKKFYKILNKIIT